MPEQIDGPEFMPSPEASERIIDYTQPFTTEALLQMDEREVHSTAQLLANTISYIDALDKKAWLRQIKLLQDESADAICLVVNSVAAARAAQLSDEDILIYAANRWEELLNWRELN